MPRYWFNSKNHSKLLCTPNHRLQIADKEGKSLLRTAFRTISIFRIRSSCLSSHHAAAQQGSKADMGIVFFQRSANHCFVRVSQIQIIAKNSNIHLIFLKQPAQVMSISWCQRFRTAGIILQCQMGTGISLFSDNRKQLLHGKLLCIVKTKT